MLIERGRLFSVQVRFDPFLKKYQIAGEEGLGLTAEQITNKLDKVLGQIMGKAMNLDICKVPAPLQRTQHPTPRPLINPRPRPQTLHLQPRG